MAGPCPPVRTSRPARGPRRRPSLTIVAVVSTSSSIESTPIAPVVARIRLQSSGVTGADPVWLAVTRAPSPVAPPFHMIAGFLGRHAGKSAGEALVVAGVDLPDAFQVGGQHRHVVVAAQVLDEIGR